MGIVLEISGSDQLIYYRIKTDGAEVENSQPVHERNNKDIIFYTTTTNQLEIILLCDYTENLLQNIDLNCMFTLCFSLNSLWRVI